MISIRHTVQIPTSPGSGTPDQLWQALLSKARSPLGFVPAITAARVLEETEDGFIREIELRNRMVFREHVRPQEETLRMEFEQLDDPMFATIVNALDVHAPVPTYTLEVELREAAVAESVRNPGFLGASDMVFFDTAVASARGLARAVGGRAA